MDHDTIMLEHQRLLGGIDNNVRMLGTMVEQLAKDMSTIKVRVGAYESFSTSSVQDRQKLHDRLELVERWQSSVEGRCNLHFKLEEQLVEVKQWIEGHQAESKGQAKLWVQIVTIIGLIATAAGVWAEWRMPPHDPPAAVQPHNP